jgi:hypothetical protein
MVNDNNPLLNHVSGRVGDLVFRQLRGKTVISKMPRKPDPSRETVAQRRTRDKMRNASRYALDSTRNPERKAYYSSVARKLKLPNAYTAAVTEYLRKTIELEKF